MATRYRIQASITVGGTEYRARRHELHERLSEVSALRCTIINDKGEPPDPESLLDADAVLKLETFDGGQERYFAGKVVSAERRELEVDLLVVPKAWRLSKRADCRIFQTLSAIDIVKKVLADAGVDKTDWKTTGSPAVRDYTVQYRETDLAFVARLLSEEGIYYAIRHDSSANTMVFGDDPKGLDDIPGDKSLSFRQTAAAVGTSYAHVTDVTQSLRNRSDKTTLRDYNADKPKLKLESTAKADKAEADVYVWPGRFSEAKVGDKLAQILLDSIRADRQVVTGEAFSITLVPGARFSIEGHPYAPLNQEYLVVGVDLDGEDPRVAERGEAAQGLSSSCRFRAIPTSVVFRPPRVVREHFVSGAQTAVTTGSPGEEIHTDAGGHVKAQFYWDRLGKNDDKSSVWMRTSQLPTGGSMLLPRMKWEVNIRYLEGDVDRPIVMGRMYNTATPPPYALPAGKTKSSVQTATTPGGGSSNEIRMDDTKGSEEMMMNASKDMSVDVGNNTTESIGANLTRQVGSNSDLSITNSFTGSVGASQTVNVGAQQNLHVSTFLVDQVGGNQDLTVGGARHMKVGGDHKRDVGGDSSLDVGSLNIDLVVGAANEHTLGNLDHHVSAALVDMTGGGRSVIVGGDRTEKAALAKVIITNAGRSVDVSGKLSSKTAGLVYRKTDADLTDKATGGDFLELAAGAQMFKANKISIEGQSMVAVAMGASTLVVTPSNVILAGLSIKIDGETVDDGALIIYL
jgi:type VI secretion system secreted protein VgrG